jgi:thymidylate kinase
MTAGRVEVAEAVAQAWNEARIAYGVVHGLETYPRGIGRDLDVLMPSTDVDRAITYAERAIRHKGWPVALKLRGPYGKRVVAFGPCWGEALEIDIRPTLDWRFIRLDDSRDSTYWRGPFRTYAWGAFVKRVLLVLLGEGPDRFSSRRDELSIGGEEAANMVRLPELFGPATGTALAEAIYAQDFTALQRIRSALRRELSLRALANPHRSTLGLVRFLKRRVARLVYECGPIVAVVGPDGVGKSTTIDEVGGQLPNVFTSVQVRHWRPNVLPQLGSFLGRQTPAGAPPRRTPGRFGPLRLLYYWIDFVVGHVVRDRPASANQAVIIYDRTALDMSVDPVRFGLKSAWGTSILWSLSPKPDVTVVLGGAPSSIAARKRELSESDIQEELRRWHELLLAHRVDVLVAVDDKPEVVAKRLAQVTLEAFCLKNRVQNERNTAEVFELLTWITRSPGDRLEQSPEPIAERADRRRSFVNGYAVYPTKRHPRVVIPVAERSVLMTGAALYRPANRRAAVLNTLFRAALRIAPTTLANRSRVKTQLASAAHVQQIERDDFDVIAWTSDIFRCRDVRVAASLGSSGPHRKPVIHVIRRDGTIAGHVKIGWNPETQAVVEGEEQALTGLHSLSLQRATIPRVLFGGKRNGLYLLALGSVPAKPPLRLLRAMDSRHVEFLIELFERTSVVKGQFRDSTYWKRLRNRIDAVSESCFPLDRHLLISGLTKLEATLGPEHVPLGRVHGDFTPWNVVPNEEQLHVFDWEYSVAEGPPGYDVFHYVLQTELLSRRRRNPRHRSIIASFETSSAVSTYFRRLRLPRAWLLALLHLYGIDILSWYIQRDGMDVDHDQLRLRREWRRFISALHGMHSSSGL